MKYLYKMINTIQYYHWGSKTDFTKFFNIKNTNNLPMAELWIGAHFKHSSYIINNFQKISLHKLINYNAKTILGYKTAVRFSSQLPFLLKILCVKHPLSIQTHPNIFTAREGFLRENFNNIPLNALNRSYVDNNHKPELVLALTTCKMFVGFQSLASIIFLLQEIIFLHPAITKFLNFPSLKNLKKLFFELLLMTGKQKYNSLNLLHKILITKNDEPWNTIRMLASYYPYDNNLLIMLLLNLIHLTPGQGIYIVPQTMHVYLSGLLVEVMANSDNVLRAGFTTKYINVNEVIKNITFHLQSLNSLIVPSIIRNNNAYFPDLVEDFACTLHILSVKQITKILLSSAVILFCIHGYSIVKHQHQLLTLHTGESIFIFYTKIPLFVSGTGILIKVFNKTD